MKTLVRKLIPQKAINFGRHKPTAILANLKYGFPSKKMTVIGVTGTDGKTTTVNMIYRILKNAGKKVSMVSTINAEVGGKSFDTGFHVTSPDPFPLQKLIKGAKTAGDEIIILEVTSHALDQYRFWGVHFDIGVITNITHDHFDYHKTFENYFETKAKLIKDVGVAVLNRGENHFEKLSKKTRGKVVSFGLTKNADFNPYKFPLKLKIPGDYNLLNAYAAAAVAVNLDVPTKVIKETLEDFSNLEGRFQSIENKMGINIIVDFAHTPNAMENVLKTLRKQAKGKLITVFGCAGLRDVEKRPEMGEISARLSDNVVITSEDPRGLIDKINEEILKGVEKAGGKLGEKVFIEIDRQKAISLAVLKLASKGDTVAILGKGHEKSLNLDGVKETPWSDVEAVHKALVQDGR